MDEETWETGGGGHCCKHKFDGEGGAERGRDSISQEADRFSWARKHF